jgi:hypothetical protein
MVNGADVDRAATPPRLGHYGNEGNGGLAVLGSVGGGLAAVGAGAAYMAGKPTDANFEKNRTMLAQVLANNPESPEWQNRIRQMDSFISSDEVRMMELEQSGVSRPLLAARRKAVRAASDAFVSAKTRDELQSALAQVRSLDHAIDVELGNAEPFPMAPMLPGPPSLKPVPAGITGKQVGNALAKGKGSR